MEGITIFFVLQNRFICSQFSIDKYFNFKHFQDLSGKEKDMLENEAKTKLSSRAETLEKAKALKIQLKI